MKLFRSLAPLFMMGSALLFISAPITALAAAGSSDQACQAIQVINPSGACDSKQGSESALTKVIRTVLQLLSLVAGVIAVIMLIVAGFKYITSQGDATGAASARNTLIYAIVGIVIVVFAQMLVKFVLRKAS
jgi:hypothetical protein